MRVPDDDDLKALEPEDDSYFALALASTKPLICRKCLDSFPSRNKLFKHVYANSCEIREPRNPGLSKQCSRVSENAISRAVYQD
jgi:hypothetical protein